MAAAEGGHVTLHCKYITDDPYPYLFWFQQKLKVAPKLILNKLTSGGGSTESEFKERFNASLDTSTKTVPLSIQDLQISDSAVYYCALRPTVMAACSALVQKPLAHIPLNSSFLTKLLNFIGFWLKMKLVCNMMNAISLNSQNKITIVLVIWVKYTTLWNSEWQFIMATHCILK